MSAAALSSAASTRSPIPSIAQQRGRRPAARAIRIRIRSSRSFDRSTRLRDLKFLGESSQPVNRCWGLAVHVAGCTRGCSRGGGPIVLCRRVEGVRLCEFGSGWGGCCELVACWVRSSGFRTVRRSRGPGPMASMFSRSMRRRFSAGRPVWCCRVDAGALRGAAPVAGRPADRSVRRR